MSFFFSKYSVKRENAVKEAIISCLGENAREIQFEVQQNKNDLLELSEATSLLCTTLEAIFLHGLKESMFTQTINVIVGDEERRPDTSFWSPVMIFLHKQVIEQIQSLTQITSDTGQCRAWVRLSLNESVLSAYLSNIRKNPSVLSPFYKKCALLKDNDRLEIAVKILEEIETNAIFKLPVNSSLLNHWSDFTLQLSGLWTPPLKSCPIISGVDVAGSISAGMVAIPQPLSTNEIFAESISNSPFATTVIINDSSPHGNFEEFLQKVDQVNILNEEEKNPIDSKTENTSRTATDNVPSSIKFPNSSNGNSLTALMKTSWSSDVNREPATCTGILTSRQNTINDEGNQQCFQRSVSMTSSQHSSYNTLLRKHEANVDVSWTDVWENFLLHNAGNTMETKGPDESTASELSSEDISSNCEVPRIEEENYDMIVDLQNLVKQLCTLAREPGLNNQGFLCKSCQHPLGIGYKHFRVCAFSGNYYCCSCMHTETVLIPAQIIYNWNFRKYAISKHAATFLFQYRNQPFIDLKLLNPIIYQASEAMAEIQSLRIRLNYIRAYLYTCPNSCLDELKSELINKSYLYEFIHQYSISDLAMIQRGCLTQQLQKAYKIGESHVLKCNLCSLKGFICEICKSAHLLYPFHIETTFKCESCGAVFHANCLNDQEPCPRCERRQKREAIQIIEACQN